MGGPTFGEGTQALDLQGQPGLARAQLIELGLHASGVEPQDHLVAVDEAAFLDLDLAHDAAFEMLTMVMPVGTICPGAIATLSTCVNAAHSVATTNRIVPVGDGPRRARRPTLFERDRLGQQAHLARRRRPLLRGPAAAAQERARATDWGAASRSLAGPPSPS